MQVYTGENMAPIKVWASEVEEGALEQAHNIAKLPFLFRWVALMPDTHAGYGMPIGGVAALDSMICPNMVGVDIGCGMGAVKLSLKAEDVSLEDLKPAVQLIRDRIPTGFNHHKENQHWNGFDDAPYIEVIQKHLSSARKQLGTLGGGNHFIEVQKGDDGHVWLMVHSGSRNFGLQTAKVYHAAALKECARWMIPLPDKDLAYFPIESPIGQEYLTAMNYCLRFAQANRRLMMERLTDIFYEKFGASILDEINIHHNYAAIETHFGRTVVVHRKGATSARAGQRGIIPGSMGAASYIVEGLGNPDSFMSCSHGAGRRMGRKQAQRSLDLEAERAKMEGIIHGLRNTSDLDEAPGAYKDIDVVMRDQEDLVKITTRLSALASVKG